MYLNYIFTSIANVWIFYFFLKANSLLKLTFGPSFRSDLFARRGSKRISASIKFRELGLVLGKPNRLSKYNNGSLSKHLMASAIFEIVQQTPLWSKSKFFAN